MFNKKIVFGLAIISLFFVMSLGTFGCGANGGGGGGTTTSTSSTTTSSVPTFRVSGRIDFADFNLGIKGGVTIQITGSTTRIATTDAETGTFEITGVLAGPITIEATKTNWTIAPAHLTISGETTRNLTAEPAVGTWVIVPHSNLADATHIANIDYKKVVVSNGKVLLIPSAGEILSVGSGLMGIASWTTHESTVGEPIGIVKNNDGDPAFVAANGNVYSTNGSSLSFKMGPITLEAGIYPEVLNVNIDPTAEAIGTDGFRYTTHDTSADPLVWSQWSSGYNSLASANYLGSLETIVISSSGLIARITEGEMPYTVRASDGAPFRDIAYAENTGFPEPTLAVYFIVSASGEVIKYEHYSIDYDSISIDISGLPVSLNGVCSYIHEGYIDIYVCGDNGLLMYRRFEPL